jgi:hypothetical protein
MQTEHSTAARKEKKAQRWYLQLWFQVLVAMAIGIALTPLSRLGRSHAAAR